MKFDLGKQVRESKGISPAVLRSYFQGAARNAFRILAGGPPKAHAEAWEKEEGIKEGDPQYASGGFLLIRTDANDAEDFDATNVIIVPRDGESGAQQEAIKVLDALEVKLGQ